jgi:hypothetical protein
MTHQSDDVRSAGRKRLEERRGFVPHVIVFLADWTDRPVPPLRGGQGIAATHARG